MIMVIIAGFFLRFLFPLENVFHFDQEQIAIAAQKILDGHLTLIGPLANTISFFTGPLIYYLAVGAYWLTGGHPLANALVGTGIYLLSAICIWFFLRRLTTPIVAWFFIGIYSLSAHIVILGRWLAYQAHFAGFVLAAEVVLLGAWLRRWRYIILSLSGLVLSLIPTFIFDLRHDWLNSRGLLAMISNPNRISGDFLIYQRFFQAILISLENLTKIMIPVLPKWGLVGLGALVLGFWLKYRSSIFNRRQRIILLVWILVFPLVVMFYHGSTPEYYYLMQLPAFVFILTDLFLGLKAKLPVSVILAGFCLIALGAVIQQTQILAAGPSLNNKFNALEYIKKNQLNQPVELVFDMDIKDRFGWNYLIDYLKILPGENSTKVHLIYPINSGAILTAKFGGIGVWFDRRGEVDAQAFVDDIHGILFYYPNDYWQLDLNRPFKMRAFIPQNLGEKAALDAGIFYLYLPKNEINKYFQVSDKLGKPGSLDRWQSVSFLQDQLVNRKTLTRERKEDLFIFSFPQDYTWKEVELFLSQVEGF